MGNAVLKTYFSYHEMIMDFASLSPALDAGKTLSVAPPMSFYTTDGRVALGGNFIHFLVRLREETGIQVHPFGSEEHPGYYLVSYEDYAPVELKTQDKIEVKAVDTPAKKRAQRTKK
ncbi:hypothetical protein JR318_gp121 [Escherichia phage vB_vPM_PD06]|uniref:Phi92_gp125 n=6 Tax=Justusliebigvirus TaxID=2948775 RepID=I7I021_9CAUD|nr:Phi92_gp125 [Escherichia phage phi92]YP_009984485.1 hypothetical protein JR317_gp117 [Escherichia phage vB_EcoM_PHB05]YP_009984720.1 hypothetical protein JR318_gp121 [Escherichia phage vB_vPM_PD06]YP_009985854.1 hypothetical protein JR322_gp009 [Escherichia phage muut]YP_009987331.1 hypothetical protein JR328_gp235 [Escherichia phage VEcB]AMM43459.1 hypothetical protein ECGD1_133 [Enterobacteria phage ECGD1]AXY81485.1 hypothetical protein [Escherichia phage vB_vPM_PD114]EHO4365609.1 hypot